MVYPLWVAHFPQFSNIYSMLISLLFAASGGGGRACWYFTFCVGFISFLGYSLMRIACAACH